MVKYHSRLVLPDLELENTDEKATAKSKENESGLMNLTLGSVGGEVIRGLNGNGKKYLKDYI